MASYPGVSLRFTLGYFRFFPPGIIRAKSVLYYGAERRLFQLSLRRSDPLISIREIAE